MNGDLRGAAPMMLGLMALILGSCSSRTTTPPAAIRTIEIPPGGVHVDTMTLAASAGAVLPISGGREIAPGTYRIVWNGVLTLFDPDARPFGNELALEHRVSAPITIEHDPPAKTP